MKGKGDFFIKQSCEDKLITKTITKN